MMRHPRVEPLRAGRGLWCLLCAAMLSGVPPSSAVARTGETPAPSADVDASALASAVLPRPAEVRPGRGAFLLRDGTELVAADGDALRVANYVAAVVARTSPLRLRVVAPGEQPRATGVVRFALDPSGPAGEGYALEVRADGIDVRAREPAGLFYGGVTLWQLATAAPSSSGAAAVPAQRILDAPRFRWRGFMLDVARHYVPPEEIRTLLDRMALHKLNVFHWHLTDDQGWRIPIRRYPRLTEIGGCRVPAVAAGTPVPPRYCAAYTHDEIRAIVAYAAERHITVVPEIEMPGHAQAALYAYPEFGTEDAPPGVSSDWGVHTYLYGVHDATFAFLEDVLAEVLELFPGRYVHVGGDEAAKDRWLASPRVQARRRELGLEDEHALQLWFVQRIERFLASRGRTLIGWDEIVADGLPSRAAVMAWRGMDAAADAARRGHDVVVTPAPTLYLDYLQGAVPDGPPGRPTYVTLADLERFEPVPPGLDARAAAHVLGAQLNAWTEHMRTPGRVVHAAFPRIAAFAEAVWSPPGARGAFLPRLAVQLARYDALGIEYSDAAFAPDVEVRPAAKGLRVAVATQNGHGSVRYTLDGSEPSPRSQRYTAPFEVPPGVELRAATFDGAQRLSRVRVWRLDAAAPWRRASAQLRTCSARLPLRLEDDDPAAGPRAAFDVDILDPCWIQPQVDLARVRALRVAVGRIPFNFQVGADRDRVPKRSPRAPGGEFEVRLGSCDGELLATAPLASVQGRGGVVELPALSLERSGVHDLCYTFTRPGPDPIWVIDRVEFEPRERE